MKHAKPLIIALAPLLIGLSVYYVYWRGEASALAAAIESVTGKAADISGFPYRLSAHLRMLRVERGGEMVAIRLNAGESQVSSGPFRAGLYVGYMRDVTVAAASGIPGITAVISAPEARGSLRASGLIERLSMRFERATIQSPLFKNAVAARELELHFRETPNPTASDTATPPGQAEGRLAGIFTFPGNRQVGLSVPLIVTATAPIVSFGRWRDGGTIEIADATINIGGSNIGTFDATLAALPDGKLSIAGTLATDCPGTVTALLTGRGAPAQEYRTRRPAKLALGGTLRDLSARRLETAAGGRVRSQEPPCPALRR